MTERDLVKAINSEPYLSSPEKAFIDSISELDGYGFHVRQWNYWIPESREKELERLEINQSLFKELVKGGHRFPSEINKARMDEYYRIRELNQN